MGVVQCLPFITANEPLFTDRRLPNAERSQGRGAEAWGVLGRGSLSVLRARGGGSGGV